LAERLAWLTYHPLTIRRLTSGALRRQAARRRPPSPPAQPADRRRGAACLCAEHGRYTCQPDYMPTTCWPMVRGGPRLEAALSFIGHRFAAAWVRVRAALGSQLVSVYLYIYLSIYLSIYPSIYPSIHLSTYLSINQCIRPELDPALEGRAGGRGGRSLWAAALHIAACPARRMRFPAAAAVGGLWEQVSK
jgi:hypothetical protein